MLCPKCKTQNPDNAQSCWFCNTTLTSTPPISVSGPIPQPKTSGLAITALVLAILSPFTCLLTAIPAVILGIVALVKIDKSAGQLTGKGLAIAGIVSPVVALPLIGCLMGIMMPALARVRQVAFRLTCASNMSALAKAMLIYANDYEDKFPAPSKWCDLLIEHCEVTPATFCCNGAPKGPCNYAMNINVQELGTNAPPNMVLLFETTPGWNQTGGPEILSTDNHQGEGCNIAFVDGHIEFIKTEYLSNLKWDAKENQIQPPEPIPLPP